MTKLLTSFMLLQLPDEKTVKKRVYTYFEITGFHREAVAFD